MVSQTTQIRMKRLDSTPFIAVRFHVLMSNYIETLTDIWCFFMKCQVFLYDVGNISICRTGPIESAVPNLALSVHAKWRRADRA